MKKRPPHNESIPSGTPIPVEIGIKDEPSHVGSKGLSKPTAISSVFADHLVTALQNRGVMAPLIIQAEQTTLLIQNLPVRGQKAKLAALPFALEDRISAPLDEVHIALCRGQHASEAALACVVGLDVMTDPDRPADAAVLPEIFALPAPAAAQSDIVWAVWRSGERVLVRQSDETGFGIATPMLPLVWRQADQPKVIGYGDPLPDEIEVSEHITTPPPPADTDMAVDLRQGRFAPSSGDWRGRLGRVAAIAGFGLVAHFAIAAADTVSLQKIAENERRAVQAAIAPVLPGVEIGPDIRPILRRLDPAPPPTGSAFLPLVAQVSAILLETGTQVGFRRMTFADEPSRLTVLLEMPTLEDLQRAERLLRDGGLNVSSGAATASTGIAEAEFSIAWGQDR